VSCHRPRSTENSRTNAKVGLELPSEREQLIFLQMAQTWLQAATLAEQREAARDVAASHAGEHGGIISGPAQENNDPR